MPKWGLTNEQRESRPWGLDPDLLSPGKTITDPVHGDVYLTNLEVKLLDSPPIQRLRRVKQLGTTHLTYPGATHSRFSHVLGTLRAAQNLIDVVVDNRTGPRPAESLLAEWERVGSGHLYKRVAEATVLARLGALLHDIGHVPMGHTIEDDLGVLERHDANSPRFDRLWSGIDPAARNAIEEARSQFPTEEGESVRLFDELLPLVLSKSSAPAEAGSDEARLPRMYPFVADIVGNTICADLLDYIRRDHYYTGLPLAVGTRFAADFYVRRPADIRFGSRMVIRVERDGRQRADILSEIVKLLRYRYELTERALAHHSKLAADAMIGKLLNVWSDVVLLEVLLSYEQIAILFEDEPADLAGLRQIAAQVGVEDEARRRQRETVEDVFLAHGDEGLLEWLSMLPDKADQYDRHRQEVRELARAVLERRLYKVLAQAGSPAARSVAAQTYDRFGKNHEARRRLEQDAARFAGVAPSMVALWVPDPDMRLKVADVLVDDGQGVVAPLSQSGLDRDAVFLTQKHRNLWAVSAYGGKDLISKPRRCDVVLAYLQAEMQLPFTHGHGRVPELGDAVAAVLVDELGLDREAAADKADELIESSMRGAAATIDDFLAAEADSSTQDV